MSWRAILHCETCIIFVYLSNEIPFSLLFLLFLGNKYHLKEVRRRETWGLIVQKFGGTSVGSVERILNVA